MATLLAQLNQEAMNCPDLLQRT